MKLASTNGFLFGPHNIANGFATIACPDDYDRWLDVADQNPADLIRPFVSEAMLAYPVSSRVSSPKNDDATLIEPIPTDGVS